MKSILIKFFLMTSLIAQQVDTVIVYSLNQSLWLSHDSLVVEAFKLGYKSVGSNYTGIIKHGAFTRAEARSEGAKLFIKSYTGFLGDTLSAYQNYQDGLLSIMPAGSNAHVKVFNSNNKLPSQVSTGAGSTSNSTGYDIEFFGTDPFNNPMLSSFSNGYVAGQLAKIKDSLNCSWWEVRYRARQTASNNGIWNAENGYGEINISAAINYNGSIPSDPYVYIPPPPTYYLITLLKNYEERGQVTGNGSFLSNTSKTITAISNLGSSFVNWTENGNEVSKDSNYTFTVTNNRTLTANFKPPDIYYELVVLSAQPDLGVVYGGGSYISGSLRTISAPPYNGNSFIYWEENGSVVSTNSTFNFTLNANRTLIAYFTEYVPQPIILGKFQTKPIWRDYHKDVILFWDIVANTNKYKIYRRLKNEETWTLVDSTINSFYIDTTITRERVCYRYKIVAELNNEITESAEFNVSFLKYDKLFYKKE